MLEAARDYARRASVALPSKTVPEAVEAMWEAKEKEGATATSTTGVGAAVIYPIFTDAGNKLGNYTVTTNTALLTITKAPLAITADNQARAYGRTAACSAGSWALKAAILTARW